MKTRAGDIKMNPDLSELKEEVEEVEISQEEEVDTEAETREFTPEQMKKLIGHLNSVSSHIKHRDKKQTAARKKSKLAKASRKKNRKKRK